MTMSPILNLNKIVKFYQFRLRYFMIRNGNQDRIVEYFIRMKIYHVDSAVIGIFHSKAEIARYKINARPMLKNKT